MDEWMTEAEKINVVHGNNTNRDHENSFTKENAKLVD